MHNNIAINGGPPINPEPRMEEMSLEDRYYHCAPKFYNASGDQAPFTTTTSTSPITTQFSRDSTSHVTNTASSEYPAVPGNLAIYIGAGSGVVLLILVLCCCLCRERKKRRRTEERVTQYLATTVTSVTESVDGGATYDDIPNGNLVNPTYNKTDILLPSRKRKEGVSGTLTRTVKRLFSSEEDHPPVHNGNSTLLRRLPSIPETNPKSNSFPRSSNRNSFQNPEYEEIGPHLIDPNRSIYNPLDDSLIRSPSNPYARLRKSNAMRKSMSLSRLSEMTGSGDNYFLVENVKKDETDGPRLKGESRPSATPFTDKDAYFVVEKSACAGETVQKVRSADELCPSWSDNSANTKQNDSDAYFVVEKESGCSKNHENSAKLKHKPLPPPKPNGFISPIGHEHSYSRVNKTRRQESSDKTDEQEIRPLVSSASVDGDNKQDPQMSTHDYFILEKHSSGCESDNNADDYLKPLENHRHSYIDVLAEMDIARRIPQTKMQTAHL